MNTCSIHNITFNKRCPECHDESVLRALRGEPTVLKHFVHPECSSCKFLGTFDRHDLYVCDSITLIARAGNEPWNYKSTDPDNQTTLRDIHLSQAQAWFLNGSRETLKPRST